MTTYASHSLQARDAFIEALGETGFRGAVEVFAREHPPTAHRLVDQMTLSPAYADELRHFARGWGLDAPWFLELIHDLAWESAGNRPVRSYGHRLPDPFARFDLLLRFAMPGGEAQVDALGGVAVWLHEPRALLRKRLLDDALALVVHATARNADALVVPRLRFTTLRDGASFESDERESFTKNTTERTIRRVVRRMFTEIWEDVIQPARLAHGATPRNRRLPQAGRDARAIVANGFARTRRRRGEDSTEATGRILAELWPGTNAHFINDALEKAIVNFRRELRQPVPAISDA